MEPVKELVTTAMMMVTIVTHTTITHLSIRVVTKAKIINTISNKTTLRRIIRTIKIDTRVAIRTIRCRMHSMLAPSTITVVTKETNSSIMALEIRIIGRLITTSTISSAQIPVAMFTILLAKNLIIISIMKISTTRTL